MTKILAHRGANRICPENTMSAFKKAYECNADGYESDVFVLHDLTPVIHHDFLLGRCENVGGNIYDYRRENIQSFSVGEKYAQEFAFERIPLFEDLLKYMQEKDLFFLIEMKSDVRQECPFIKYQEDIVLPLIKRYGFEDRCAFVSLNHQMLLRLKSKYPEAKISMLYLYDHEMDVIDYTLKNGFDIFTLRRDEMTKENVEKLHSLNLEVSTWPQNNPEMIRNCLDWGIDYLVTDDIETAMRVKNEWLLERGGK
ncbi:MAG: hypothetical protein IJC74_06065 [Clostridia bacterium]|nr:hypothetical protein [Clostridia bacterium]